MRSGREDNFEARYAIKISVKLMKKSSTETYEIPYCFWINLYVPSICFHWHKMFKDGRKEMRADVKCRRERDVRTSKLVDEMAAVHRIIHEDVNMYRICAKFILRVLSDEQTERRVNDSREMVELFTFIPSVLESMVTCIECWIYHYDPRTKKQNAQWQHLDSPKPKKVR
ncbi:protein GVQW3-like [Octopus sinensis]|uniref:Protein GVQW3-like n=1 Tax=Octopus sinensis TaxID=2607531 RepID=A0A6P7TMF1_9MOLL|nr:protein GVQW3-like [Octopus sinensis]